MAASKQKGLVINANTIIGIVGSLITTVLGAILIWLVTTALQSSKDTKEKVTEIKVELPHIVDGQKRIETDVKTLQGDTKEIRSSAVSRSELDNKHNRLLSEINEVKTEQKSVREELKKNQP